MASKAYLIDAAAREIREVEVADYHDITKHLGITSPFCVAWQFANNDVIYVDDEGLLKGDEQQHFFWLADRDDQPLAGNGLLMGADDPRDDSRSLPPRTTLDELKAKVRFMDRAEALAWARSAPPGALDVTVTTLEPDGSVKTEVLGNTMATAFPEARRPETG